MSELVELIQNIAAVSGVVTAGLGAMGVLAASGWYYGASLGFYNSLSPVKQGEVGKPTLSGAFSDSVTTLYYGIFDKENLDARLDQTQFQRYLDARR